YHDPLTDLPNRDLLTKLLGHELPQMQRAGKKLAVLYLDLDHFKNINDSLGHEAGDVVLRQVVDRLRSSLREFNTLARVGGDKFTILLPLIAQPENAAESAENMRAVFKKPFTVDNYEFHITASIGISLYPDDGGNAGTLLKNAEIAMYHAKDQGRNNYQFFNTALNIRTLERIMFENSLRRAVEREELFVCYQPQIDTKTREIIGAEALVRWRHPELGLLTPLQFIPLAEETGLILQIDQWVLRTACAQLRTWQAEGCPLRNVSVNLSSRQFQQSNLAETIGRILEETGLGPESIGVEITETLAMQDTEFTARNLSKLDSMGIRFAIDDFGTGYSSLSYLKRLPIHKLKVDKSFIMSLTRDPDYQAIVSAVIAMAHILKLKVIAEGVETEEQLAFLHETHCDEAQGYLFSKPLPAEEFEELLAGGRRS
ncbi:MAG TPA: bifunctional diguanylate cyclase/phosphodiesterase, partial [Dissulfurispiraceae bacterium]